MVLIACEETQEVDGAVDGPPASGRWLGHTGSPGFMVSAARAQAITWADIRSPLFV